jgi:hypothetical protein
MIGVHYWHMFAISLLMHTEPFAPERRLCSVQQGCFFQGPQSIGAINREIVSLLQRDGYTNISQAVGADHPEISRNLAGV